jgi:hypothetical protein
VGLQHQGLIPSENVPCSSPRHAGQVFRNALDIGFQKAGPCAKLNVKKASRLRVMTRTRRITA